MAPRATRVSRAKPKPTNTPENSLRGKPDDIQSKCLPRHDDEQQRLFVLPKGISPQARIITLPNPATGSPGRYLFCPERGLFEFMRTSPPKNSPSSWLLAGEQTGTDVATTPGDIAGWPANKGYVLESADLFVATPIDPLFFLTPLFAPEGKEGAAKFRLEDDYVDVLTSTSKHMESAMRRRAFKAMLLNRLGAVSEIKNLGEDRLCKPEPQLLAKVILQKAEKMVDPTSWPPSMEESLVRKPLEMPSTIVRYAEHQLPTPEESQDSSIETNEAHDCSFGADGALEVSEPHAPPLEVLSLMRLRVAFSFVLSSYVPRSLRSRLGALLEAEKLVDFSALDAHLAVIQKAKVEAQALRSLSVNVSRKRALPEDDEAVEMRAEKLRRKEAEDLRKKTESRAIKQLKKVDTSGMQKLSSFFKRAPAKAADAG